MAGKVQPQGRESREVLLAYLKKHQHERGYLPTIQEMATRLGMNPTGVKWHLSKLREEKKVTYEDGAVARSLRLRRGA